MTSTTNNKDKSYITNILWIVLCLQIIVSSLNTFYHRNEHIKELNIIIAKQQTQLDIYANLVGVLIEKRKEENERK